jgi:translocator protein
MSYRGRNSRPNWLVLFVFLGLGFAADAIGALFSHSGRLGSAAWYAVLSKPAWAPPGDWFGPIWAVLYVLMGTAVWLVWRERYHRQRAVALGAYAVQLSLNTLWAPLFFGAKSPGAGLFVSIALWLTVVWTIREFLTVRAFAAWLLAPYLVWVSFAVSLNLSIWRLNP